ncbi:MAG: DedA family protein [Parachlamydiaceae bacterium]|nr:DedA family protein [Parachlamydiaceae bacterium]
MESIFSYICEHSHHAPWILFSLLLLSGLCIPISEDVVILGAGALASTCIPDHTLRMYLWILVGCYLSAWEAYWIGRLLGPKLYRFKLFGHILSPKRLMLLRHYYAKFGIFTFIVGRFCPGGVRNALFMSSGLTKMPFPLFVMRDGLAAFISTSVYFFLGFKFGENLDAILYYLNRYTEIFIACMVLIGAIIGIYFWKKHRQSENND